VLFGIFTVLALVVGFLAGFKYQQYKQQKCAEIQPKVLNVKDTKIIHADLETS
jgi:hypothetical protein